MRPSSCSPRLLRLRDMVLRFLIIVIMHRDVNMHMGIGALTSGILSARVLSVY